MKTDKERAQYWKHKFKQKQRSNRAQHKGLLTLKSRLKIVTKALESALAVIEAQSNLIDD